MINYVDIEQNILLIEGKYNDPSTTTHEQILYSKLAIIEFCGWIEESLDQVMKDYTMRTISVTNQRYVEQFIIRPNSGFKYDKNLKYMFGHILGMKNLEDFEFLLDDPTGRISIFEAKLKDYSKKRNDAAHNSTPVGTTLTFFAPSTVLGDFRTVKPIFSDIELIVSAL